MFTINIEYTTGDSFGSSETSDTVSAVWQDKQLARKALQDIKAHYEFYTARDRWGVTPRERSIIEQKARQSTWYDEPYPEFSIKLLMDDGTYLKVHCFWTGYFETLHKAEVVVHTDSDGNSEDCIHF